MIKGKFTYKRKKQLFTLLLVLLAILAYKRVLKKSYIQTKNYFLTKNEVKDNGNDDDKLTNLNKAKAHKVEIIHVNAPHFSSENDYLMVSNMFTFKGNYNSLIKMINQIEKEFKTSKLNSLLFYKKKNFRSKKNELYLQVLFQNFKKD